MLFKTVYGAELPAIYRFIAAHPSLHYDAICAAFLQQVSDTNISPQSVDDALSFLESAYLINQVDHTYTAVPLQYPASFSMSFFANLRRLQAGTLEPHHPLDPLYLLILEALFIKADTLFVQNPHRAANQMRQVTEYGDLSSEKIQAWQRVLEFLGVGQRVSRGFRCVYSPTLMWDIINASVSEPTSLQSFFETHLGAVLPFQTSAGDLAQTVAIPLLHLAKLGVITLDPLQDSPSKPYFGQNRWKQITLVEKPDVRMPLFS